MAKLLGLRFDLLVAYLIQKALNYDFFLVFVLFIFKKECSKAFYLSTFAENRIHIIKSFCFILVIFCGLNYLALDEEMYAINGRRKQIVA